MKLSKDPICELFFRGEGWNEHVSTEHNVYAYIYFTMYLQDKVITECTAVEKYVKHQIKTGDIDFFPINKSVTLNKYKAKEVNDVQTKFDQLVASMNILAQKYETLLIQNNST